MRPAVSVILPFRNAEHTLECAILSILHQTFEDFELLCVNNASQDESVDRVKQFRDSRIRLITEPEIGVVAAARAGLKEAKGTFVARMDADDWSFPDRLKKQCQFLQDHSMISVVSGKIEPLQPPSEGLGHYLDWINSVQTTQEIYLNQFVELPVVNPSIMTRKSTIEEFGYYKKGPFPEDYELFLRYQAYGVSMGKIDSPVLKWNDLEDRLTRTDPTYTEEAFNKIKSEYLAKWLQKNNRCFPKIWVWGAGKQARHKSAELLKHGLQIGGFIEVNEKTISDDRPVVHYKEIPTVPDRFIVSYVSNWGARKEIKNFLSGLGWIEGRDFILAG